MTDKKPTNNVREAILLGVLVLLILASGVQAYQLHDIKQSISDGTITTSQDAPTPTSSGAVPQNLQDLPQMVGGC